MVLLQKCDLESDILIQVKATITLKSILLGNKTNVKSLPEDINASVVQQKLEKDDI